MTSASTTPREKTTTIRGLVGRIMVLSLTLVAAIYLVPLLIAYRMWLWLAVVVIATGAMFLLYSTRRFVPAKYLFPGTFFLTVFLISSVRTMELLVMEVMASSLVPRYPSPKLVKEV